MSSSTSPPPALKLDPSAKLPPLAPVALAKLISSYSNEPILIDFEESAIPTLSLQPSGSKVEGYLNIVRQLANLYAPSGISGKDKDESAQVDLFISQGDNLAISSFQAATAIADDLDQHLALRTFLVGNRITAADIAVWSGIRSALPVIGLVKKGLHVHLGRWFSHVDSLSAMVESLALLADAKANKFKNKKEAAGFDLFLKDAKEGQVVTRFPPEPSGYLHVGHAKAAILNQYFAKAYKGRLIVRFDDTNPSKEKVEFEESIIEDLALLGIKPDVTSHTSDYFDELYKLVIKLIQDGKAYADDTPQEQMRAERMDGIASKNREASIEENLSRFAEMSTGSEDGRKWCLRAKMSVDNPNKAMRDPVIYRCNPDVSHHRTGNKWKVYPTYDFACPVVDSLEGVTHALRTNEYRDRNPQYQWFIDELKLRNVEIWDFGRLNFVYTLLSKRKLQWFVDNGLVSGWDDPRFPTVRGIRRRGMTIETIQEFILSQGPSQQIINMEWDNIWTINKRMIDPVVPRFTALEKKDLVKCTVSGAKSLHEKLIPKHKKNAELGNKVTVYDNVVYVEQEDAKSFGENEEITMMDWGNVIVKSKKVGADGVVESIEMEANLDGDFKKTKKKVTWLASSPERRLVDVMLTDFDYLITKKKLEEDDKFEDFVTPQSVFTTDAVADFNVSELAEGDMIQFERKGYYKLDKVQGKDGKREFIKIPDGKAATSASKAAPDENPEAKKAAAAKLRAEKAAAKAKKEAEKAKAKEAKAKAKGVDAAAGAASAAVAGKAENAVKAGGDPKVKMYSMPILTDANIETPSTTKMYTMKPIL
ncbi:putative GUS1-Glutamyl-tRNA synthetase [Violaceomyces palustris]|uniref:GUS1-Glutamyl-tRNA synthetase n=1 Tax=Violaceomyces palustris TaxID=1673888 RepID=A0ACD0NPR3_9BASI|nr:putative GUS1-Glutamyl-tRNA synthetase [Violaceomyces palustris]